MDPQTIPAIGCSATCNDCHVLDRRSFVCIDGISMKTIYTHRILPSKKIRLQVLGAALNYHIDMSEAEARELMADLDYTLSGSKRQPVIRRIGERIAARINAFVLWVTRP